MTIDERKRAGGDHVRVVAALGRTASALRRRLVSRSPCGASSKLKQLAVFCFCSWGTPPPRETGCLVDSRLRRRGARARRYHRWFAAATALPSVARTLPDKERYLVHVAKYANNQARSKVGNAVRRGAAAHDYDHAVDGDGDDDAKK